MFFLPIIIFIIMSLMTWLIIKNSSSFDKTLLFKLLFKYSVILTFSFIEYLFLNKNDIARHYIIIIFAIDILSAIFMGLDILKLVKKIELEDKDLLTISRLSIYIIVLSIGLILMILGSY